MKRQLPQERIAHRVQGILNLKTAIGLYANCAAPPGARPALAAKIMRTIRCIRFAAKAGRIPGEKPRALKCQSRISG